AEDGTIEAIRFKDASGFALGVQLHAEYDPQTNPVNRALFQAFGDFINYGARHILTKEPVTRPEQAGDGSCSFERGPTENPSV
ncbi:gamma-glutamyl-gamma-aminobutyrate hydrolase family protein, partial [Rhizobium leguminosarum]|uniref:gamma-glutamyl-gamma-aminobutyrate hydrolase family protein n=1 Tax=Rhizobium leguminosarum TaxID=384 RepID=UPI003F9C224E